MNNGMRKLAPVVVSDAWEVRDDLRALGLSVDSITDIARQAAAAKAEALPIDPCSAPGTFAYIRGVRAIPLHLLPQGWRMSRSGNVESTVNVNLASNLSSRMSTRLAKSVILKPSLARVRALESSSSPDSKENYASVEFRVGATLPVLHANEG